MYGRGVIDDKGPVAASMVTLKSILDNNLTLNKRIRIIVGTDEEVL
jgi:succinyl-diaminopimelate desuccinylase